MANVARAALTRGINPEEFTSYQNILETFPPVFEEGKQILSDLAGKIQIMRLETEMFPRFTVESNKDLVKSKEKQYVDLQRSVSEYRTTLQSINGQIRRSISLCEQVPESDIRSFELDSTATKVYDFCIKSLPTLQDWYLQGTLLDKRFELIMTKDYKHYNESIGNYQTTINPSSGFLSSITATFTSLWGAKAEAGEAFESSLLFNLTEKGQLICSALFGIDNAVFESLNMPAAIKEFVTTIDQEESSKGADNKQLVILMKILLGKMHKEESLKVSASIAEQSLCQLHKAACLSLAKFIQEKIPADISTVMKEPNFCSALIKINSKLQGAAATLFNIKASMAALLSTQLECYNKSQKDPYRVDLLNQLAIVASFLK